MPRPLCIAFACLLILASPALADTDGEVYEEVDKIIGEAEEGVRGNLATFIQANERPLGKARNELAELIARLNKDGRSQLATSIQKRVNTLEDTVQKRASAKVPIVEPLKKPLLERMAGKWDMGFWHMLIEQDGSCRQVEKGNGTVSATGQLVLKDARTAEMKLTNGWSWQCSMPIDEDKLVVLHWNPAGQRQIGGLLLERVK